MKRQFRDLHPSYVFKSASERRGGEGAAGRGTSVAGEDGRSKTVGLDADRWLYDTGALAGRRRRQEDVTYETSAGIRVDEANGFALVVRFN